LPFRSEKQTPSHLVPTEKKEEKTGGREMAGEKKGEVEEKKGGERTTRLVNTTHPRKLDGNSDPEGDVDERKRRPRHVPGAKGVAPPPQSTLAKKFVALNATSSGAAVASQQSERKVGPVPRPHAAAVAAPGRPVPLGESKHPRLLVPLMDICKIDTPIIKRVPNAQRSNFASFWGRLLDQATFSKQEAAWAEFFLFPKCILWAPGRGGKRLAKKTNMAELVRSRLERWDAGEKEALWLEAVARSRKPLVTDEPRKDKTDRQRLETRVLAALRLGDVRKALQMLNSAPIAPKTHATLERLRKLHPSGDNPSPIPPCEPPRFTQDVVRAALSSFGPSSAAGLFGYKPLLLQQCARAESFIFMRALTTAVNDFASGRAPDFLKPFVAGGVSIALEKTETSVRPLACGDPLRRLVAKCFCIACKEDISLAFKGRNYGVGCPGGVEVVAHSLRDTLETHKGSKLGLLKIDFRNAFNEIKRDHFVRKVSELFPPMSNWTQWCYGEQSMLLYDHEHIIWSLAGVQQGDPLGPLYFCCGINGLVNEFAALNPVYNKWYMDDGGIVGDVELLNKVWEILKTRGPALGLHLNPSKCEWSWLDPECALPCPIRLEGVSEENQVKLVPHREIQMLGVPLGDDSFVAGFVEKRLIGKLFDTIDKLVNFEDSQAASYLLRVSYSIVRAVHFMRTTPFQQWEKQGEKFDGMVRGAAEKILGCSMSERVFAQAALTPKLGGLGLRKCVEHAGFAYSASWHESKQQSGENWTRPSVVCESHVAQDEASLAFDDQMHKHLIDTAPDEREKQRLLRVAQPHAGSFITAVPSNEDGSDTILGPRIFRTAVLYRLGLPVLNQPKPCPLCMQPINIYGDHATCCAKKGDIVFRHNAVRDLVYAIACDGVLNPQREKKGILGPTSGRRPGDVSIPDWSGQPLAIDVAVTSPITKTSVRLNNPCEEYGITQKHRKYDASFVGTNYSFCAMIFETLGAVNQEGEEVLRQLFRYAAKHLGREFSSYCVRAWARVSCALQRSVAQSILNRVDGTEPEEEPEDFAVPESAEPVREPLVSLSGINHQNQVEKKREQRRRRE
jgi:hypothetical protein